MWAQAIKSDGWDTDPFTLTILDNGQLVGRGSTDDKGPIMGWLNVIEAHQSLKLELPVNLRFCFEGMEESGSIGLDTFIEKEALKEDGWFKGVDAVCIVRRTLIPFSPELKFSPVGQLLAQQPDARCHIRFARTFLLLGHCDRSFSRPSLRRVWRHGSRTHDRPHLNHGKTRYYRRPHFGPRCEGYDRRRRRKGGVRVTRCIYVPPTDGWTLIVRSTTLWITLSQISNKRWEHRS